MYTYVSAHLVNVPEEREAHSEVVNVVNDPLPNELDRLDGMSPFRHNDKSEGEARGRIYLRSLWEGGGGQ